MRFRAPEDGADLDVSDINFTPASPRDAATGLLGWVELTVAGTLRLDGIAVRRTLAGSLTLAFPAPTSSSGRRRKLVRPVDAAARERIERLVLRVVAAALDDPR